MLLLMSAHDARSQPSATAALAARSTAALESPRATERFEAEEELLRLGNDAVPALAKLARTRGFGGPRRTALHLLGRIGTSAAEGVLEDVLSADDDVRIRALACRHLGRLGNTRALLLIESWLEKMPEGDFSEFFEPHAKTLAYAWMEHVHALRDVGDEKAIPVLSRAAARKLPGEGGRTFILACRQARAELETEARFAHAVEAVPGLRKPVDTLLDFFRRDVTARVRLYRSQLVRCSVEGRWMLEGLTRHRDHNVREAATSVLASYEKLAP